MSAVRDDRAAHSGNGTLADAYSTYGNGMAQGLTALEFRIDRLAVEMLNVRRAVAALALCQLATFAVIVIDVLARVI
jgi:hypothetical protein